VTGVVSGEVTLQFHTGSAQGRTRTGSSVNGLVDSDDFTYGDLLRDLHTALTLGVKSAATVANLTLSGLDANTEYDVQIWSLDPQYGGTETFTWWDLSLYDSEDSESEPVLIGEIINQTSPTPTSNDAFSTIGRLTSNAAGELILSQTATAGDGAINGLTISLVPEPGSMMLLGLGGLGLMARRRRI